MAIQIFRSTDVNAKIEKLGKKTGKKNEIVLNFFLFLIIAPLFTKRTERKHIVLALFMSLVSLFIWLCVFLFFSDLFFDLETIENPFEMIQNKIFGFSLVLLSSYYLYFTLKDSWNEKRIKELLLQEHKSDETKEKVLPLEHKLILKSFLFYWLVLLTPALLVAYIWLKDDSSSFSLIIFTGIISSLLGAILVVVVNKYVRNFSNNSIKAIEDFKRRNGYYPKTKYHAYAEIGLRAVRIYAIFYLIASPFVYIDSDIFALTKAVLFCLVIIIVSTLLIRKCKKK